jgi:cytidine deaminase
VGAAGTDLHTAAETVSKELNAYGYEGKKIRISALMRDVKGAGFLKSTSEEEERIRQHMDAGDTIRHQSGRNDAMVGLAISWITDYREAHFEGASALNTAFILDSLKHPAEIETMRRIYRDRFILISVHSPTDARLEALKEKIANSHKVPERVDDFTAAAEQIMNRDEHDDDHGWGQNVREAFVMGHIYVSTQPKRDLTEGIARYFRLFFGDPFVTPTPDEYAMFQTHTAALRSADLSRQVGAAVCTSEGEIIAVGCNEVPKAGGGQYWPGDSPDKRDFNLGYDSNLRYQDAALAEAFKHLQNREQLAETAEIEQFMSALEGTRLAKLTEFGRTVHAEMAALLDAARRGAAVADQQLFTTTFPCHNCARHIIGAGIKEVIFREPYEKSLASELHKDAITVDPTTEARGKVVFRRFVGVGPPQYLGLFTMRKRKEADGSKFKWEEASAAPHLITTDAAYLTNEDDFLDEFRDAIQFVDLAKGDSNGDT